MRVADFCSGQSKPSFNISQFSDRAHARPFRGGASSTEVPPTPKTSSEKAQAVVKSIVKTIAEQPVAKSVTTSVKNLVDSPTTLSKKDIAILGLLGTASVLAIGTLTGIIGPECCSWGAKEPHVFWDNSFVQLFTS